MISIRRMAAVLTLAAAISACARKDDSSPRMLMDADARGTEEAVAVAQVNKPVPIPNEPLPFAAGNKAIPEAMLVDAEARAAVQAPKDARPQPMPEEPRPPR